MKRLAIITTLILFPFTSNAYEYDSSIVQVSDDITFEGTMNAPTWTESTKVNGILEFSNGLIKEGEFSEGLTLLNGAVYHLNGDIYKGSFNEEGRRHGQGAATWKDGTKYSGSWRKGKMHGIGTVTWKNGNYQNGNYKFGKLIDVNYSHSEKSDEAKRINAQNAKYCRDAEAKRDAATGGSLVNILTYAITGGSNGNQRSFDSNNSKVAHYQAYLDANNCSKYLD